MVPAGDEKAVLDTVAAVSPVDTVVCGVSVSPENIEQFACSSVLVLAPWTSRLDLDLRTGFLPFTALVPVLVSSMANVLVSGESSPVVVRPQNSELGCGRSVFFRCMGICAYCLYTPRILAGMVVLEVARASFRSVLLSVWDFVANGPFRGHSWLGQTLSHLAGTDVSGCPIDFLCRRWFRNCGTGWRWWHVLHQKPAFPHPVSVGACLEMHAVWNVADMADWGQFRNLCDAPVFHKLSKQRPLVWKNRPWRRRHVHVSLGLRSGGKFGWRCGLEEVLSAYLKTPFGWPVGKVL